MLINVINGEWVVRKKEKDYIFLIVDANKAEDRNNKQASGLEIIVSKRAGC